jgi:hypothetical protein
MIKQLKIAAVSLIVLAAAGCSQLDKRVVFATKTNLGLDVSGTAQVPDKVSFTYGRFEGAIVPRSENGDPYSVYGGLDADVNFFGDQTIKQVFATGEAAIIAADDGKIDADAVATSTAQGEGFSKKSLFFVTDTAYGLKLSAGKQDISPTLMVGFKRVEGAVIPVDKKEQQVRSVYADLTINTKIKDTHSANSAIAFPNNGGVRIIQGFATGRAAEIRATDRKVKAALKSFSSPAAEVSHNILTVEKIAKWIAEGADDAEKKSRFKLALKGVEADDGEAAFEGFAQKDEATFKNHLQSNFAADPRAMEKIEQNVSGQPTLR